MHNSFTPGWILTQVNTLNKNKRNATFAAIVYQNSDASFPACKMFTNVSFSFLLLSLQKDVRMLSRSLCHCCRRLYKRGASPIRQPSPATGRSWVLADWWSSLSRKTTIKAARRQYYMDTEENEAFKQKCAVLNKTAEL